MEAMEQVHTTTDVQFLLHESTKGKYFMLPVEVPPVFVVKEVLERLSHSHPSLSPSPFLQGIY